MIGVTLNLYEYYMIINPFCKAQNKQNVKRYMKCKCK